MHTASGSAAAIAAAREGAKTILIETLGGIGGMLNMVGPPGRAFDHLYNNAGEQIIGGFTMELYNDLKAMDCVTVSTESTSDKIGVVRATGPKLETVLAKQGVDLEDVSKITFHGKDKYDYSLKSDYIMEHDIILAFGIDGEPLDEESAPCRIIIPKSDSAYWLRLLDRIDFELN